MSGVLRWGDREVVNEEALYKGVDVIEGSRSSGVVSRGSQQGIAITTPKPEDTSKGRGVQNPGDYPNSGNTSRTGTFRKRNAATAHLWPGREEAEGIHCLLSMSPVVKPNLKPTGKGSHGNGNIKPRALSKWKVFLRSRASSFEKWTESTPPEDLFINPVKSL